MKKMLFVCGVAIVLAMVNGCCSNVRKNCVCGVENCECTCIPCRMGKTYVKCFNSSVKAQAEEPKNVEVIQVEDTKTPVTPVENDNVREAITETQTEAQKIHGKVIPTYVEFVLDCASLKNADKAKEKPEKPITMVFTEKDGKILVAGCAGVNRYFGNAVIKKESNEIKFSQMGSTMMMGPGLEVEQIFLQTLEKVAKYNIVEDKLSFMNANGEILAVFTLKK